MTGNDKLIARFYLLRSFGRIPRMLHYTRYTIACFVMLTVALTACVPTVPTAYPTYDPFAPVNGTNVAPVAAVPTGQIVVDTQMPDGPTPTRASISVTVPDRDPNAPLLTPTPDSPHPIPSPRQLVDTYTVQPGDTLGSIATAYGITLGALMQANGLNETSLLSVGTSLNIPPVEMDPNPGSSFKIIPDSELVYGPASIDFDIQYFLEGHGGYLATYTQDVNGEYLTGAQIVQRISESYSVNPRLLIALLEYRSQWITNPTPSNIDFPLGFYEDYYAGLYRQLAWAANNLNRGYYTWRVNALSSLPLSDGSYVPMNPTINAGTAALQYFLAQFNSRSFWDLDVSEFGFSLTYNILFGNPFAYEVASLLPPNLIQPIMQLPLERGVSWSFTGGPHGGWDSGSAWAALDFAPPGEGGGCQIDPAWVVAVADGLIVRAENGAVIQDLDNDGYEQTGWTVLYMHVSSSERVERGTYVYAGERIGHPSCEGGVSNATHLHMARRYNGEWIPADGAIPFLLDGWVSSGNGIEYDGKLTKGTTVIEAWEGVFPDLNQVTR